MIFPVESQSKVRSAPALPLISNVTGKLAGAVFTVYAGYRGFRTQNTEVTVAPTATPTSAGAAVTVRW